MQKRRSVYGVTMYYFNEFHHNGKSDKEIGDVKRDVKNMVNSVAKYVNDHNLEWHYQVKCTISSTNEMNGKPSSLHINLAIYGLPGYTIAKKFVDYWVNRGYGEFKGHKIPFIEHIDSSADDKKNNGKIILSNRLDKHWIEMIENNSTIKPWERVINCALKKWDDILQSREDIEKRNHLPFPACPPPYPFDESMLPF